MKTKTRMWKAFGVLTALTVSLAMAAAVGCDKKKSSSDDKGSEKETKDKDKADKGKESEGASAKPRKAARARKADGNKAAARGLTRPAPAGKPGQVKVVVGLNTAELRKTFLWKLMMNSGQVKKALKHKGYKVFTTACKVDPMKDISSVVFGMTGKGGGKSQKMGFMIKGKFDAKKVMACAKTALAKSEKTLKEVDMSGKKALSFTTDKGEEVFVMVVGKNTIGMASKELSKSVAKGDASFGNASLGQMIKDVDKTALLWGGMGEMEIPKGGGGKMAALLGKLSSLKGGNFTVKASSGNWDLKVMVDAGNAGSAKKLVQLLNFAKMGLAMKAAKGGPGGPPKAVVEALKKLNASTDGSKIKLGLSMPEAMIKGMAGKAMAGMN
mgnify:CR=1 FL=1